jgi:hypothetical protein
MENYFTLGNADDNKIVKISRIIFGIACIIMAAYWVSYNMKVAKTDGTVWITIVFLLAFGAFQIWSGAGKATRFIITGNDFIKLKKNSVLPAVQIMASEIEKLEFNPLSVLFLLEGSRKILLRFGTVHYETNEKIVDSLIDFAESNNIPFEIKEDEI